MKHIRIYVLAFLFPFFCLAQWQQTGQNIEGDAPSDASGVGVSINHSGSIIAIGAWNNDINGSNAGQVRILENSNGTWSQIGQDLYGGVANDKFGRSVSLNETGNIIAVGAPDGADSGYVKMFENMNGTWTQIGQTIIGENNNDEFGFALSINDSGTIVAIGGRSNDAIGFSSGHARIFENINGTWTQIGQDIDGVNSGDSLGTSIDINGSGDIVAIGAVSSYGSRGHTEVYQNINGVWMQLGQNIIGENAVDLSSQHISISTDGTTVAIGSKLNDNNGSNAGHVRVFRYLNGVWTQFGQEIQGATSNDNFGSDVALNNDGSILAVSAGGNGVTSLNEGYCMIYKIENNNWTQVGMRIDQESQNDLSSFVELNSSGSTIVIGTPSNDNNGSNSGLTRVYGNALLSVQENRLTSQIAIYPNPVLNVSTIKLGKTYKNLSMIIYDTNGRKIMSKTNTNEKEIQIDATYFSSGIYIINLILDKEKATIKMIKK